MLIAACAAFPRVNAFDTDWERGACDPEHT